MTILAAPLAVHVGSAQLPLTLSTDEAGELLGCHGDTVREGCRAGRIPILERVDSDRAPYRIPTARLLAILGVPFKVGASK